MAKKEALNLEKYKISKKNISELSSSLKNDSQFKKKHIMKYLKNSCCF
jgi:hypothetical protein